MTDPKHAETSQNHSGNFFAASLFANLELLGVSNVLFRATAIISTLHVVLIPPLNAIVFNQTGSRRDLAPVFFYLAMMFLGLSVFSGV